MGFIATTNSGFENNAKRILKKIYSDDIVFAKSHFKGVLIIENKGEVSLLKDNSLIAKATKYDAIYPINKDIASLSMIAEELLPKLKDKKIQVRCKRRGEHNFGHTDVEKFFVDFLNNNNVEATKDNPDIVLSIEIMQGLAYVGLNKPDEMVSNLIPQRKKYAEGERPLNRAEFKLREAIRVFNIKLDAGRIAIDIGSAPGGWAKVLAGYGLEVIAVDPGDLDGDVLSLSNVRHFKCRAEDFRPENKAVIITNDMNINPKDSAAVMCSLAGYLEKDGVGIMTVKFVTPDRKKLLSDARLELEKEYTIEGIKKMPHNGYETTLFLRKK